VALRRAGKSRREIKELLAITSNWTLNEVLRGEPPQPWTWRPNAKDDLRANWAAERPVREAEREAVRAAAAAQIGRLNDREVLIAGAIAYWCEGGKNKPDRRDDRVNFINSGPALTKLFLRFLDVAGIGRERLIFRVYIHESADLAAAQRLWLDVTQARPDQFRRPVLKRHNPRTVRKNTGENYHGCLRIDVRRGSDLYRKIDGWAAAAMTGLDNPDEAAVPPGKGADLLS
jgi:hypothetical protein